MRLILVASIGLNLFMGLAAYGGELDRCAQTLPSDKVVVKNGTGQAQEEYTFDFGKMPHSFSWSEEGFGELPSPALSYKVDFETGTITGTPGKNIGGGAFGLVDKILKPQKFGCQSLADGSQDCVSGLSRALLYLSKIKARMIQDQVKAHAHPDSNERQRAALDCTMKLVRQLSPAGSRQPSQTPTFTRTSR